MPRRGEENRRELLQAGESLLQTQGYAASGVQQITAAAGVPKGSFYNYFASKEEFAGAVIRAHVERLSEEHERMLLDAAGRPAERIGRLLERDIESGRRTEFRHGSLLGNLCQELAGRVDLVRQEVDTAMRRLQSLYAEVLFEAQQAGELSDATDADQMAGFLYSAWQGALMRCKATRTEQPLRQLQQLLPTWIR